MNLPHATHAPIKAAERGRSRGMETVSPAFILILIVGVAGATALARALWRRFASLGRSAQWLGLGFALLALACWVDAFSILARQPAHLWADPRLVFSFALWNGEPLYAPVDSGPALCNMYGPMMAVSFLPSVLGSGPYAAIWIGSATAALFILVPVFLIQGRAATGTDAALPGAAAAVILFHALLLHDREMIFSVYSVHADAPAIGYGLLACLFVRTGDMANRPRNMALVSLMLALGVWTKQVLALLYFIVPIWIALTEDLRVGVRFVKYLIGVSLPVTAVCFLAFGPAEVWFNLVTYPGEYPWYDRPGNLGGPYIHDPDFLARLQALALAAIPLSGHVFRAVCIVFALVLFDRTLTRDRSFKLRTWLKENDWALVLAFGFGMIPLSLAGRMKVGGDVNSYSFTVIPVVAAAALCVVRWTRKHGTRVWMEKLPKIIRTAAAPILICYAGIVLAGVAERCNHRLLHTTCLSQKAFDLARERPGQVWFPWCPTASMMAEKRAYHFDYGVLAYRQAGYEFSQERFDAHLPPDVEYIVDAQGIPLTISYEYMENWKRAENEPLPGWSGVFVKRGPDSE